MTRYRCDWHDGAEFEAAGLTIHASCIKRGHVTELPQPGDIILDDEFGEPVSLFDRQAAQDAKREAMTDVDENALDEWKDLADAAIVTVAKRGEEFTTDDVWALLDASGVERPHEPRAIGPRIVAAANAGIIEPTDRYGSSVQRQGHGRPVRIYRPGPRIRPVPPI